jgi:hypothetical protein
VGVYELYKLFSIVNAAKKNPGLSYVLGLAAAAGTYFARHTELYLTKPYVLWLLVACQIYLLVELFRKQNSVFKMPAVVLAFFYVILPCALLIVMSGAQKQL